MTHIADPATLKATPVSALNAHLPEPDAIYGDIAVYEHDSHRCVAVYRGLTYGELDKVSRVVLAANKRADRGLERSAIPICDTWQFEEKITSLARALNPMPRFYMASPPRRG